MERLGMVMAIVSLTVSGCGVFVDGPWVDGPYGEWTDSNTGYTWLYTPPSDVMTWQDASDYCDNLTFYDHDDWHLPTISELRSLIRGCSNTQKGGSCGVTDSCLSDTCWSNHCDGCSNGGGPAEGCYWPYEMQGTCDFYWSSSYTNSNENAWGVYFGTGHVDYVGKFNKRYVRCMRPGT